MKEETPAMLDASAVVERLRAVICECRAALEALRRCAGEPAVHVHTLRKRGKRLRGGMALLRAPRRVMDELRDMGRILGLARDAAVREETLMLLREEMGGGKPEEDGCLAVAVALLAEEASLSGGTPPTPVLAFVEERLATVEAWLDRQEEATAIASASAVVVKLANRATKRLARLTRKGLRQRHFHQARKAVKRWQGARWFLVPEDIQAQDRLLGWLEALGDDLGVINDLAVLSTWLDRAGLTETRLPGLHRAALRRRRHFVARCGRRAGKIIKELAQQAPASTKGDGTC